jgi:hypothetical protein
MTKIGFTFFVETGMCSSKLHRLYFVAALLDEELNHPLNGICKLWGSNFTV